MKNKFLECGIIHVKSPKLIPTPNVAIADDLLEDGTSIYFSLRSCKIVFVLMFFLSSSSYTSSHTYSPCLIFFLTLSFSCSCYISPTSVEVNSAAVEVVNDKRERLIGLRVMRNSISAWGSGTVVSHWKCCTLSFLSHCTWYDCTLDK